MKPEDFRLKISIRIRRNWNGVKIHDSKKIDENTIIINLATEKRKWYSFEAFRHAIGLSVEAVIEDSQVIAKIHKEGYIINKEAKDERIILPVLFINQEDD